MYQARCPSCGAKLQVPEGQAPPRCGHCWSFLVRDGEPSGTAPVARAGTGLDALLNGPTARTPVSATTEKSPATNCPWCGMDSEPGLFCSDCGSPLLTAV